MPLDDITYTPNLHLEKLPANFRVWAQRMNDNLTVIDAAISGFINLTNFVGVWTNSTDYVTGNVVADSDDASLWACIVSNTSPSIPTTFAEDRVTNPSYWVPFTSAGRMRGEWTGPGTLYNVNDYVTHAGKTAVCLEIHTSTSSFDDDVAAGKWSILLDGSAYLPLAGGTLMGPLIVRPDGINDSLSIDTTGYALFKGGSSGTFRSITGFSMDDTFGGVWIEDDRNDQQVHIWLQGFNDTGYGIYNYGPTSPSHADLAGCLTFIPGATTEALPYLDQRGSYNVKATVAAPSSDALNPAFYVRDNNNGWLVRAYAWVFGGASWSGEVDLYGYGPGQYGGGYAGLKARGTSATKSIVQNGDVSLWIEGVAWNGSDWSWGPIFEWYVDGVVTPGANVPQGVRLVMTGNSSWGEGIAWNVHGNGDLSFGKDDAVYVTASGIVTIKGSIYKQDDQGAYAIVAGRWNAGYPGAVYNTTPACNFAEFQLNSTAIMRYDAVGVYPPASNFYTLGRSTNVWKEIHVTTPTYPDNTTKAATTAYVTAAVAAGTPTGWRQIGRVVPAAGAAAVNFTGLPSDINNLKFVVENLIPQTNDVSLLIRFYDGTGTLDSANNYSVSGVNGSTSIALGAGAINLAVVGISGISTTYWGANQGLSNIAGNCGLGSIGHIVGIRNSVLRHAVTLQSSYINSTSAGLYTCSNSGMWTAGAATTITGVQFAFNSGNFSGVGAISLWGSP